MSLWSAVVVIAFLGWLASLFGFIRRALTPEAKLITPKAIFWGGLVVVFWAGWIIGLLNA